MFKLIVLIFGLLIMAGCASAPMEATVTADAPLVATPAPKDTKATVVCKYNQDQISFSLDRDGVVRASMTYDQGAAFSNQVAEHPSGGTLKLNSIQSLKTARFRFNDDGKCTIKMFGELDEGTTEAEIKCVHEANPSQIPCTYKGEG